jgi:hypothetical protein
MSSYYFIKWRFQNSFYSRFWMFNSQFATSNMAMSERKIILQRKEKISLICTNTLPHLHELSQQQTMLALAQFSYPYSSFTTWRKEWRVMLHFHKQWYRSGTTLYCSLRKQFTVWDNKLIYLISPVIMTTFMTVIFWCKQWIAIMYVTANLEIKVHRCNFFFYSVSVSRYMYNSMIIYSFHIMTCFNHFFWTSSGRTHIFTLNSLCYSPSIESCLQLEKGNVVVCFQL